MEKQRKTAFQVAPAFASTKEATAFLAVMLFCLAWPTLNYLTSSRTVSELYWSVPTLGGSFQFMSEELQKTEDIDVLVVGGSDVWTSMDSRTLEDALRVRLGRSTRVLNFANIHQGLDSYYQRVYDTISKRHVKLVLFPDQPPGAGEPHPLSKYLWRYFEIPLPPELTLKDRATIYATAMLGAPYQSWSSLKWRRQLSLNPQGTNYLNIAREQQGFDPQDYTYAENPSLRDKSVLYKAIARPIPEVSLDAIFYPGGEQSWFSPRPKTYTPLQAAFLQATDHAVRKQGGVFAMFSVPVSFPRESASTKVDVTPMPPGYTRSWPMIGIPMSVVFQGMSFTEMKNFYKNRGHLNTSGGRHFSLTIANAVAELVKRAENR